MNTQVTDLHDRGIHCGDKSQVTCRPGATSGVQGLHIGYIDVNGIERHRILGQGCVSKAPACGEPDAREAEVCLRSDGVVVAVVVQYSDAMPIR